MVTKNFALFEKLESKIIADKHLFFTLLSVASTFGMILNSIMIVQPVMGAILFAIYFVVNGTFVGHFFFEDERTLFKLSFGFISLTMLIVMVNVILVLFNEFNDITNILSLNCITVLLSIVNHKQKTRKEYGNVVQNQSPKKPHAKS